MKPAIAASAYDLRLGLRADTRALLDGFSSLLPPGTVRSTSSMIDRMYTVKARGAVDGIQRYDVEAGGEWIARTAPLSEARKAFENHVRLFVAEHAPRWLFVHAGVVGWRKRALVIPGCSFSGKSRLVKALIEAGADYYSDEYAVFDPTGRVHPYARPLQLREPGTRRGRKYPPEDFGARVGRAPLQVGLVLRTRYASGTRWRPAALSPGEAMLALLHNAVPARSRPAWVMQMLRQVVASPGLRAFGGKRGDASDLAPVLLELLAGSTRSPLTSAV